VTDPSSPLTETTSVPEQDFFSFDEALNQLNLKEEELKRLVSEGEIRAFREGDTMKLRRADVENLKKELMGGEVVDLAGAGEDLVFEDDLQAEETGMATEEISDMDTLLEEEVEDVGEVALEEELLDADLEEAEEEEVAAAPVRRVPAAPEVVAEGMLFRSLAILTSLILVLAIPVVLALNSGRPGAFATSLADMFAKP
jgi:excisionase family DNA binding protein